MGRKEIGSTRLAQRISTMSEIEVCQFIRQESRKRRLSKTVRALNREILSEDFEQRRHAEDAIRRLGFI